MIARSSPPKASWTCLSRRRLMRSEEHTSELQSRLHLVCRLLLEKKKKIKLLIVHEKSKIKIIILRQDLHIPKEITLCIHQRSFVTRQISDHCQVGSGAKFVRQ